MNYYNNRSNNINNSYIIYKLKNLIIWFLILINNNFILNTYANQQQTNLKDLDCYDYYGRPQRCIPPFENAAYNLRIEATNTCGEYSDTHFCVQTQNSNKKSCDVCGAGSHSPDYLTDSHNPLQPTWWQSETMFDNVQYPNQVNLTLQLGKSFDITYIRLVFYSPRPESFAIYKRQAQNGSWTPYQYYSATCRDTYRLPDTVSIKRNEDEARALCTSEYSDISPLRDGNIAFSTLEGRPSAYNFDNSTELQNWVTATDIQISLNRLNTFGDEVFGDAQVLRSYFYAIADIAVGARCKCNGHANKCVESIGIDGKRSRVCQCRHNTDGPDCEKCLPFFNDAPWGRATSTNVHECKQCNCNGFSNKCFFDRHLYNSTGHGGHCVDCLANRDGANCERCKENFYMREDGVCVNCNCDPIGSRSLQCNVIGKCQCKPGVTGDKCDQCEDNFYNFGQHGCQQCNCNEWGSLDNIPSCDQETGECVCKENVEGHRCRECKPGFFNLDLDNRFGCTPCFCYGHTSECQSATGYSIVSTASNFNKHKEKWRAVNEYNEPADLKYSQFSQNVATAVRGSPEKIYFLAPDRFLGDQRASYNRLLKFKLQLSGQVGPDPSSMDVILEGAGTKISLPIFAQNNHMPDATSREYAFRLHEHLEYSWQPSQSSRGFMSILSNLTAIKIRATYASRGEAYLDDVELQTAHRGAAGKSATWIEHCTCPNGYLGQFCESCASTFRHSPALGGPFMPCVPCDCHKHSDMCHAETGHCICQHNTAGDTCDQCAKGYYGNALGRTPYDCKKCPCPEDGACMQMADDSVICLECPTGYFGSRCELCSDGYYGDPTGLLGREILCKQCDCNGNVDPNAVGNCNRTTGECLKCIHNTAGPHCDQCLPGHFGDPLGSPHGKCDECSCYPAGTEQTDDGVSMCDHVTGNCRCKPNVSGKNCNECKSGYFNIASGNGCEGCNCDPIGSYNSSCDRFSGKCYCKPGVTGLQCDQCLSNYYGYSNDGCKACNCDSSGSKGFQCDQFGQCPCNDNVEGERCDRCKENKYDRHQGCINCPDCYNLVQNAANDHRAKLRNLTNLLQEIASKPTVVDDIEFEFKLKYVQEQLALLQEEAEIGTGGENKTPKERLDDFEKRLEKVREILAETNELQKKADYELSKGERNVTIARKIIDEATAELSKASDIIKNEGNVALKTANKKSDQLGQQSGEIGEISQSARTLAENIINETEELKRKANEALAIANVAYLDAKGNITRVDDINEELSEELSEEIALQKENLNSTSKLVQDALEKANQVYEEALSKFAGVDLLVPPEINLDDIKRDLANANNQKNELEEQLDIINKASEKIFTEYDKNMYLTNLLLTRAGNVKNDSMQLLDAVNDSYEVAKEAVLKGDNTLKQANNTYYTLAGFQNQVEKSHQEANQALAIVKIIEDRISHANELNRNAEKDLQEALRNANEAKQNADDAQNKYAEPASKDAELIQKQANDTKSEAKKLHGEANQLAGRVASTTSRIDGFDRTIKLHEDTARDAKKKVGKAEADVLAAETEVNRALVELKQIIEDLSSLQDINIQELDLLDNKLTAAEEELNKSNIARRLESLKDLRNYQNDDIELYTLRLSTLEANVDNIKQIAEALPDGCFKNVRLEV